MKYEYISQPKKYDSYKISLYLKFNSLTKKNYLATLRLKHSH